MHVVTSHCFSRIIPCVCFIAAVNLPLWLELIVAGVVMVDGAGGEGRSRERGWR